ncbi:MAG: asparagine synthase-related protein [Kiritimatiellia bacterium]
MAGIAGMFGAGSDKERAAGMIETMRHRGADSREIRQYEQAALGVCAGRLSPARGNGFTQKDNIAVLLDGEIYNDRPRGQSDADVVMDEFEKHGLAFPAYLEGVFASAVYDGKDVVLARDPVGVRPLYAGTAKNGALCFASEMKALSGLVEDVWEMHPSTTYSARHGTGGYVARQPDITMPAEAGEAAEKLRVILSESVKRRIEDGAVGACLLSGGLDSSVIAAAAREIGAEVPAVTVGVEGAQDLENAELMAKHLNMKHEVHIFDASEIETMVPEAVRILESFDEDCVSGAISNLFASRLASGFTNCILSGEGGDELFGGYHLLKELPTDLDRLHMMHKLVAIAYNTAVQRLDRAMMGNGINYRTPFIDPHVIAFADSAPVQWKIHPSGNGTLVEKWILREAFRDLLPDRIYRRVKLRFSAGTGTDDLMDEIAGRKLEKDAFTEESRNTEGGYRLNSPKEMWYYRIFKENFPGPAFEKLVGRWDPGK